jgi:hypothetical protein
LTELKPLREADAMRTKGEKRIAHWMVDFGFSGKNIDRDFDPETSRGYHDAIALLNKVIAP